MALDTFQCNYLTPLHSKGLTLMNQQSVGCKVDNYWQVCCWKMLCKSATIQTDSRSASY